MTEQAKEQRLRERIKASYEAYIQRLKATPAPDLIEMASEIAAAKFVYEELMVEGYYSEYTDYLLQFEDPLEVVRDAWLGEEDYDHHEELDHALWELRDRAFTEKGYPMKEEPDPPSLGQEVTMC